MQVVGRVLTGRVWWPYALIAAVVTILRIPTLTNRILSIDEASYLVHALRLNSFEAFTFAFYYRTETKTQVGLLPYILANALDRDNAIFLIHLFGLVMVLISSFLLITISRRFIGSPLPGLIAGLIWALYLVVGPGSPSHYHPVEYESFQAPRLEYFQVPPLLLGLFWFLLGCRHASSGARAFWLFTGVGAAWALAVLIKPSALPFGFVLVAALPFFAAPELATLKQRLKGSLPHAGALAVGAAVPIIMVFAPYLFNAAALRELQYNLVELSGAYIEGGSIFERGLNLLQGLPLLLAVAFALLPAAILPRFISLGGKDESTESKPFLLALIVLAGVALFVGVLPGQSHLYYLVPVVPFMGLAIGTYLWSLLREVRLTTRPLIAWSLGIIFALSYILPQAAALVSYPGYTLKDTYLARDRRRFDLDAVVAFVKEHSPEEGKVWVYYNTPEVLLLSRRSPVTRDPAGIWLNYIWTEEWFRRITDDLIADLPHLIVGINNPRYHYPHTKPLLEIPILGEWIASTYDCQTALIRGATVCKLNKQGP